MKKRIAIIGAGIGGTSILRRLVEHEKFNTEYSIDIYDKEALLGRGFAFKHDSKHLLINTITKETSLKEDLNDYSKWLNSKGIEPSTHTSRDLFGEYVHHIFRDILSNHKNIHAFGDFVDDIIYDPKNTTYSLKSAGVTRTYDTVFFVPGTLEYSDPYDLKGTKNFIHNPYPVPVKLEYTKGTIGIIGSGLSSIDIIRYLVLEKDIKKLYVFSRHGELPAVRCGENTLELKYFIKENIDKYIKNDHITLGAVTRLFNKELRYQNIDTDLFGIEFDHPKKQIEFNIKNIEAVTKIELLILKAENLFTYIYMYLNQKDKTRYLKLYHPLIEQYHSPMPLHVAKGILEWTLEGRLIFVDEMDSVETDNKFIIKTQDGETYEVDELINATGPTQNIKEDSRPIFKNLLNRMLITDSEFGGIPVSRNFEIISPRHGILPHFYAIGEIARGTMYRGDGVAILVHKSKEIITHFYETE